MDTTNRKIIAYVFLLVGVVSIISVANVSAQNMTNNNSSIQTPNSTSKLAENVKSNISSSIPINPTINEALSSKVNVTLSNAISIAENKTGPNSKAISASLETKNGFLVYDIKTTDSNETNHKIIIDPGNGKVILDKQVQGYSKGFFERNYDKSFAFGHGFGINCQGHGHSLGSGMNGQWEKGLNGYRNSFFNPSSSQIFIA